MLFVVAGAGLTALETVSGPGYCLITSMPMSMRAVLLRFARRAVHTLSARTAGVNVSRVPLWTEGTSV